MELSLQTSSTSYAVCDVSVKGWNAEHSRQVRVRIMPRDKDLDQILLDLSIGDSLDLIAAITSELRGE